MTKVQINFPSMFCNIEEAVYFQIVGQHKTPKKSWVSGLRTHPLSWTRMSVLLVFYFFLAIK